MQTIHVKTYSDNLYNPANNSAYDHYVFFEANHISSVIADVKNLQILQLQVLTSGASNFLNANYDELKSIAELKEILDQKFRERKVIICSSNSCLVPESLLNVVETEAYYTLNQKLMAQSQVLYSKMHVQQTATIFNVRNELMKLIRFNMPMVDVFHASLLFIKAIENQSFENPSNKLHLQLHAGYFELLNIDKQINFYNTFQFETETEIVYHVLAVAEQLQIPHTCDIVLYGNSIYMNELNHLLAKYVRSVQYGIKPKNFTYPPSFKQFEEHQFFTESAAFLCE